MKLFVFIVVTTLLIAQGNAQSADRSMPALQLPLADTVGSPIQHFTVTQKENKALLRWRSDSIPGLESFYAIERSTNNGLDFSPAGIIKNTAGSWSEFLDEAPPKGKIFYRVKLSAGQSTFYSPVIAATPSADASCKFYPNPVDKVLIVRSELSVDIQITDAFGKPLLTERLQGGLKVIDVSSLEPGIYVITLFQKESNKLVTEKLVKK